jgi:hypothetical protein
LQQKSDEEQTGKDAQQVLVEDVVRRLLDAALGEGLREDEPDPSREETNETADQQVHEPAQKHPRPSTTPMSLPAEAEKRENRRHPSSGVISETDRSET